MNQKTPGFRQREAEQPLTLSLQPLASAETGLSTRNGISAKAILGGWMVEGCMSERFRFTSLPELFAKANEEKSGDQLAGIGASSERERVAAKKRLADLTLDEIVRQPLIAPEQDEVTRLILETFDQDGFNPVRSMTVGEFREYILADSTSKADLRVAAVGDHP